MAETFGSKLAAIRGDLLSIVDRMNRDRSLSLAMMAQTALMAIATLEDQIDAEGIDEIDWTWDPREERRDG